MPAHALDDTHASQTGTFDGVKFLSNRYKTNHPTKVIARLIANSRPSHQLIFTGGLFFLFIQ